MASTANKKYLTDENGNKFYPIGHTDAIYDSDGNTLSSVLSGLSTPPHNHTVSDITDFPTITRGSQWFTGTAISGTSTTTGAYTWNDSEQKYIGDMYLNTSNGNVYKCTTAGSGTGAKWTYVDSIFSNSKAVSIETSIKLIQKIENKSTAQMSTVLGNIYSKISNPTVVEGDTYKISGAIPDGTIRYLVGSYEVNDDREFMYPVYIDNTATSKSYQIVNSAKEMYPLSTKHDALILFEGKYAFVLWATN